MQSTIHVRIGKGDKVLGLLRLPSGRLGWSIDFKSLGCIPLVLDSLFNLDEIVSLCEL
jgi:hypothetical protein